jgi:hypothetical protein
MGSANKKRKKIRLLDRIDSSVSLPRKVLLEYGRVIYDSDISQDKIKELSSQGLYGKYFVDRMASIQDLICLTNSGRAQSKNYLLELEPVPTAEQLAWAKSVRDGGKWVLPLPEGYSRLGEDDVIIRPWGYGNGDRTTERVMARQLSIVDKPPAGGTIVLVNWYVTPLDRDELLFEYMCKSGSNMLGGSIRVERENGHYVFVVERGSTMDRCVAWPCGNFVVYIEMPKRLWDKMIPRYLEKYPSDWKEKWKIDLNGMMLRRLDKAIKLMTDNLDGPLEQLRYSFQRYPFDEGWRYAMRVAMTGDLQAFHTKGIESIFESWIKQPADKITLADYRNAMLAHRKELLARTIAERDRIARDGYVKPANEKPKEP